MPKRSSKKNPYKNPTLQRNAAKWRVAGLRSNLQSLTKTHSSVLHSGEIIALDYVKELLSRILNTWEEW